jgi:HPt (histidine-containing phosphotransfer) domain-containing protein
MSKSAARFAQAGDLVTIGKKIQISFPELIQAEAPIRKVLAGRQAYFELKSIFRLEQTLCFDLRVNRFDCQHLLLLLDNVMERLLQEQMPIRRQFLHNSASLESKANPSQEEILNPIALQELEEIVRFNPSKSIPQFLREVIDEYLIDADQSLQQMQSALIRQDMTTFKHLAYTLDSHSATLGATVLADICKSLVVMANMRNFMDAIETTEAAIAAYQKVKVALEKERQRYQ